MNTPYDDDLIVIAARCKEMPDALWPVLPV